MADATQELAILIRTEVSEALKDFQRTEKALKDQGDQTEKTEKKVKKLNATYRQISASLAALVSVATAVRLVDSFRKQEQAVAALDASLVSMGRTSEGLSGKLQSLASEIQREGIIGDEAIIQGQSFLTTYGAITDDLLPRTSRIMADIAAKMGGDTVRAANLLGKASMGMVGELQQAGITLSDTAKESTDFVTILEEIETQVKGTNKALADTATGGIDQFSNAWGDVQEQLGEILALGVSDYMRDMSREMGISNKTIRELGGNLKTLVGHIDDAVIGITGLLIARTVGPMLKSIAVGAAAATVGTNALTAAQVRMTIAMRAGMAVGTAYAGVVGLLGGPAGIAVLAAGAIYLLSTRTNEYEEATDLARESVDELRNAEEDSLPVILASARARLAKAEAALKEAEANRALRNSADNALNDFSSVGLDTPADREIKALRKSIADLKQELQLEDAFAEADRQFAKLEQAAINTGKGLEQTDDPLKKFVDRLREQRDTLGLTSDELLRYQAEQAIAESKNKSLAGSVRELTEAIIAKRQALRDEEEAKRQAEQAKNDSDAAAKEADRKRKEQNENLERQAEYWRNLVNPMNEVAQQIALLDELLDSGRISWETYSEAIFLVEERLDEMQDKTEKTNDQMDQFAVQAARNMQSAFADFLFDPFSQGLDGMLYGFVQTVHRMVSEALAAKLANKLFGDDFSKGGDLGGIAGGFLKTIVNFHQGGIVGAGGGTMRVSPLLFANAPRYHSGGIVGLSSSEVPAVLQKGEEVLPESSPRHINNAGGGQMGLNLTLVDDRASLGQFMSSSEGNKTLIEQIRRNSGTIRRVLSI